MTSLGIKAFAREDYSRAETLLRDALRVDRDNILAAWNLSRVYYSQGRNDDAVSYIKYALTLARRLPHQEGKRAAMEITKDLERIQREARTGLSVPVYGLMQSSCR
ncbi:MAG: tetratricopeptide repeat protein [Candidatus Thorarchaeota archaeon]|nr:tetratricopeptide repeat protein [Candidatus Thorarchaeota archaeon]